MQLAVQILLNPASTMSSDEIYNRLHYKPFTQIAIALEISRLITTVGALMYLLWFWTRQLLPNDVWDGHSVVIVIGTPNLLPDGKIS